MSELLNNANLVMLKIKKQKSILPLKKELSAELEELLIDTHRWIDEKNSNKLEKCIDILEDFHNELAIYEKEASDIMISSNQ